MHGSRRWTGWAERLPSSQWKLCAEVLKRANVLRVPFALGGTLALATHTGKWRTTKDMDIYVLPQSRDQLIDLLSELNLRDIQDEQPYDPRFLYRATNGDGIIEIIWEMQNQRAVVDATWLMHAEEIEVGGLRLRVTAPEELIWAKIYVISRSRCDWPDIFNLLYYCGHGMDWKHLVSRLGDDSQLLTAILFVLTWLSPHSYYDVPLWVLEQLGVPIPAGDVDLEKLRWRSNLLNRQDWFWPHFADEITQNGQPVAHGSAHGRKLC